jgi:hypothetical protein
VKGQKSNNICWVSVVLPMPKEKMLPQLQHELHDESPLRRMRLDRTIQILRRQQPWSRKVST